MNERYDVYLSGSMTSVEPGHERWEWNKEIKARLEDLGLKVFSPYDNSEDGWTDRQIVQFDLDKIDRSTAVVLNASHASWGASQEILHASCTGKTVIACCPAGVRRSPFLTVRCRKIYETWDEVVADIAERFKKS